MPRTVGVVKYFVHESGDLVKDPNRVNALVTLEGKAKATGVLQMSVGVIALLRLSVVGAAGYTFIRTRSPGARIDWGFRLGSGLSSCDGNALLRTVARLKPALVRRVHRTT